MSVSLHIQFERAELRNDIEWFNTHYETNRDTLYRHFQATNFIFSWDNFINWKKHAYDVNDRAYIKLLTMKDADGNLLWKKCGCGNSCDNLPRGLTRTVSRENSVLDDMNSLYNNI